MTKEELERLYMDIYDNGISNNNYKEKFKRYVNNRLENLEKEKCELLGIIQGKDKAIADLKKENAELKEQNANLIAMLKSGAEFGYNKGKEDVKYDLMMKLKDEGIVTPLKDSIFYNQRLSSQEQQELCSWIECAMDFGENLDECSEQLEYAKTIIQDLLDNSDEYARQRAMDFLEEVENEAD